MDVVRTMNGVDDPLEGERLTVRAAELDAWQQHWSPMLRQPDSEIRNLTGREVRNGVLRGVELLLGEQSLVPQWLEAVKYPGVQQADSGMKLSDAMQTLGRLVALLPAGTSMAPIYVNAVTEQLARAAGAVSALPIESDGDPWKTLCRDEVLDRVSQRREDIAAYVSDSDPALSQELRDHVAGLTDADSHFGSANQLPVVRDCALLYWQERLLALEQTGNSDALAAEVERGRQLLAEQLTVLQQELASPTSPGNSGSRSQLDLALAKTEGIVQRLVAVAPGLPNEIAHLPSSIATFRNQLLEEGSDQAERQLSSDFLRRYASSLNLGAAAVALEDTPPFIPRESNMQSPRMPRLSFARWRNEPVIPETGTWTEIRPHALAYTEYWMEKLCGQVGPNLVNNYRERLHRISKNMGPIAAEIAGRPFDLSGIALEFCPRHVLLPGVFESVDQQHAHQNVQLGPDEVTHLATALRGEYLAKASYVLKPNAAFHTAKGPTASSMRFNVESRAGQKDPNLPPTDADLAQSLFHEWRHAVQFCIALGESGNYGNVKYACSKLPEMLEGDADDFGHEVLVAAAKAGMLNPDEVSESLRIRAKEYAHWRSTNTPDPYFEPYPRGLTENRIITLGLSPQARRAVVELILGNPVELGRREGERLRDWARRVRERIAPGRAPTSPALSQNGRRIYQPGTRVGSAPGGVDTPGSTASAPGARL